MDDQDSRDDRFQVATAAGHTPPVVWLGILSAAWSLFVVIGEVAPVKLNGLLEKWVVAYQLIAEHVVDFLFGWISWGWMRVHPIEIHFIILMSVLYGAVSRSEIVFRRRGMDVEHSSVFSEPSRFGFLLQVASACLFLPVLLAIMIPWWLYILFFLFYLAHFAVTGGRDGDASSETRGVFRKQLGIVLFCVAVLLLANYTVFLWME